MLLLALSLWCFADDLQTDIKEKFLFYSKLEKSCFYKIEAFIRDDLRRENLCGAYTDGLHSMLGTKSILQILV